MYIEPELKNQHSARLVMLTYISETHDPIFRAIRDIVDKLGPLSYHVSVDGHRYNQREVLILEGTRKFHIKAHCQGLT